MGRGKDFLMKRAPFYLAGAALFVVFVVPPLFDKGLEDIIPYPEGPELEVLNQVLEHRGPNDTGIDMIDAISAKIESEYPSDVYGHRSTTVEVAVVATSIDTYRVTLEFESNGERLFYDWDVDSSGNIRGNNDVTKDAVDMVNFYD